MSGIINKTNINKTIRYLKKNGFSAAFYAAKERVELKKTPYTYLPPTEGELEGQRNSQGDTFISVVMPAYNTPEKFLREVIESVLAQTYTNWELLISDATKLQQTSESGSTSGTENDTVCGDTSLFGSSVYRIVSEYKDPRIVYFHLSDNLGISGNTNKALEYVKGDYVCLLDHDDLLTPDALFRMAEAMTDRPALIYSDEDKLDSETGTYFDGYRKLDFNYDLFLTNNYICHLTAVRRDIVDKIRFRRAFDGAQDFDYFLQVVRLLILEEKVPIHKLGGHIKHIPIVLYHWRCHAASTAENTDSKLYAYEAGLKALAEHIAMVHTRGGIPRNLDNGCVNIQIPGEETVIAITHSKHLGFYNVSWGEFNNRLFTFRPEIGGIISRIADSKGKMSQCIIDSKGNWLFEGMNMHYAGDKNLFDCNQNVYAADIRWLRLRPELESDLWEFLTDKGYLSISDPRIDDYKTLSMEYAEHLREEGYLIVYTAR